MEHNGGTEKGANIGDDLAQDRGGRGLAHMRQPLL